MRGHLPHRRRPRRRRRGAQRFAPLNSWPDNASLDKARRLLWPIKQKYGRKISWADLLVFAGNCRPGVDGVQDVRLRLRTRGHLGARGRSSGAPEDTWLGDERYSGDRELAEPARRGADGPHLRQPRGAQRQPGPAGRRQGHPGDLRPHGDERRGDGRAHRRRPHVRQDPRRRRPASTSVPSPRAPRSSSRASAGRTASAPARASTRITSGLEGAWTNEPTKWDNGFLENLFRYEWELTTSPAGAKQWTPDEPRGAGHRARRARSVEAARADDADDGPRAEAGPDLRADLEALPREPGGARRSVRQGLVQAAAPRHGAGLALPRPVGPGAAAVAGPGPRGRPCARRRRRTSPRSRHEILASGLSISQLVSTAWASAATLPRHRQARRRQRGTDPPRAAEGLGGQRARPSWPTVLADPRGDPAGASTRSQSGGKKVSLADLIVLGGCAAVEQAAKNAGHDVTVPFAPGRTDASQEQTDVESFAVLEPSADGFRNYLAPGQKLPAEDAAARPGVHADADRPRDDGPDRRPARPRRQLRAVAARRLHRPAGDADERLLREPARHGHGVEAIRRDRERVRGSRPRDRRAEVDRAPPSTSSSARTPSSEPSPRSTRATTPRRSSCATSSPPGTRS